MLPFLALAVAASAHGLPRGVPMSKSARYAGDSTSFACSSDGTATSIAFAAVNDGYCDCPGKACDFLCSF